MGMKKEYLANPVELKILTRSHNLNVKYQQDLNL